MFSTLIKKNLINKEFFFIIVMAFDIKAIQKRLQCTFSAIACVYPFKATIRFRK